MIAALQKVRGWEQHSRQCKQEARSRTASVLLLLAACKLDPEIYMLVEVLRGVWRWRFVRCSTMSFRYPQSYWRTLRTRSDKF